MKNIDNAQIDSAPYITLGLLPGAGEDDIRSAYRRLAKLYHPDHDSSAEGQFKYREIRAAYDKLRKDPNVRKLQLTKAEAPPVSSAPPPPSYTPPSSSASYQSQSAPPPIYRSTYRPEYGAARGAGRKAQDECKTYSFFGWKFRKRVVFPKRRPFSLGSLPGALAESIGEVADIEMFLRTVFFSCLIWFETARISPILAVVLIVFSLCGAAVFRYHCTRDPRDQSLYFFVSFYYGIGVSAVLSAYSLYALPDQQFLLTGFLLRILVFSAVVLPLWVHPLIWSAAEVEEKRGR